MGPALGTSRSAATTLRRALRIAGPPLAVLVLAHLVLSLAALRGGHDPLAPAAWTRWDSFQYLTIATRGYFYAPCPDEPGAYCGDTGWLPGLPYAIRALTLLGLPPAAAGVAVALGFELALLLLVWTRWLREELTARSLLTLLAVGLGVGVVYRHAVFPMSMAAFFAALQADRIAARRWVAAGLAGAAAAFSYSTSFLLAPVAAGTILLERELPIRTRLLAGLGVGVATFCGLGAVLAIQQVEVGAWDAFFLVQARYGHVVQSPFTTLWAYLGTAAPGDDVVAAIRVHIVVSAAFVALVLGAALAARRAGASTLDRWAALYALALFLLPFAFGTQVNPVRSVSFMSPAAVALRRLPAPLVMAWLVAAAWVIYTMAGLFFAKTIV